MSSRSGRKAPSGPSIVEGLILLTGLYAAISPWAVRFSGTNPYLTANNLIVGLGVALIGVALPVAPARIHRLTGTLMPLGLWLILSPSVVTASHGVSAGIVWSNSLTGGITCMLGLIDASTPSLGP